MMRRLLTSILLILIVLTVNAQNIVEYEYWFDHNHDRKVTVESGNGNISISPDVNSLREGIHCYTFRAKDSKGLWSSPLTKYFYRVPAVQATARLTKYEYWIDRNSSTKLSADNADGKVMLDIDVSKLREGIHSFNFRMADSRGQWSVPLIKYFYRVSMNTTSNALEKYEYWVDRDFKNKKAAATTSGIVNITENVNTLREGIHFFTFRMKDSRNCWSAPLTKYFYKVAPSQMANELTKYEYWIDRDVASKETTTSTDGVISLSFPTQSMREGLHIFTFRMCDNHGRWSSPITKYFYRVSTEVKTKDNKITAYEYWFNDSTKYKTHVDVNPTNPLMLDNVLLSVNNVNDKIMEGYGYLFDVDENGKASIYSKNNKLCIRFLDSRKQWSDVCTSYFVDGEGTEVPAKEISTGTWKAPNPYKKYTRFFCFNGEKGDRVDVSTDKACTIDMYDPYGVKVLNRTLDDALFPETYNCIRNGKYYILVYNARDEDYDSLSVKFVHTQKYAVLGCNTKKVGNNCDFNLLLSGSGFSKDTKVALRNGENVILPDTISATSLSSLTASFSLKNTTLGKYDVVTSFGNDTTIVLANQIETEKNDTASNIKVEIEGNPFFLSGSTNLYTVKITNTTNLEARRIPVTISLDVDKFEDIPYIKFHKSFFNVSDSITTANFNGDEELLQMIKNYLNSDNDLRMFYAMIDSAGNKHLRCDLFIPSIAPNSSYELPFTIKKMVHNFGIRAYASQIKLDNTSSLVKLNNGPRKMNRSQECCQQVECYMNIVLSFIPGISPGDVDIKCIFGILQSYRFGLWESLGCISTHDYSKYDYDFKGDAEGIAKNVVWAILNCWIDHLTDKYGKKVANEIVKETVRSMGNYWLGVAINLAETAFDCYINKNWIGNCGGDGSDSSKKPAKVDSYDPNDKYGYVSPSGSKYCNNDVKQMNYTVEFENDPEKATAPAHDVYVTDTLDAKVFDLSSFKAGYVTAGDKMAPVPYETQNYSWDIDMRPRLKLITRVELKYDKDKGIANWHFSSIDPITDKPTTDVFEGFLPPNDTNGNGLGYVTYSVNLKENQADGTKVKNKASIVFDYNGQLQTPTWTNIKDTIPPVSEMIAPIELNDSTIRLKWNATDNASGPWKYSLYVQQGMNDGWYNIASDVTKLDYDYRFYDGIYYSFCVVATDSAQNREKKNLSAESTFYKEADNVFMLEYGKQYIVPGNHQITMVNAEGANCLIYDEPGRLIENRKITNSHQIIHLPSKGVYVLNLIKNGRSIAKSKVYIE